MSLKEQLKGLKKPAKAEPLWQGPSADGPNGGITFSTLSRFLVCRERFRIMMIEGLRPADGFNHRIEYGNMWHVCEEAYAEGIEINEIVGTWLTGYAAELCQQYPLSQEQIDHWYNICKVQFPIYVNYWETEKKYTKRREPILQEYSFNVPYTLPSGRVVRLRGKFDSVDVDYDGNRPGIWLQENKTKGDIDEQKLQRQLVFDLQTMIYVVALTQDTGHDKLEEWKERISGNLKIPTAQGMTSAIRGVRYNVVRRPLSGGKGSIVRHKATKLKNEESKQSFYGRLQAIIEEDPAYFFMRWQTPITTTDVQNFRLRTLNPILEQLCDWWEYMKAYDAIIDDYSDVWSFNEGIHWQHPFGVYNVLDEGGSTELDSYIMEGSTAGLKRADKLFPELQ